MRFEACGEFLPLEPVIPAGQRDPSRDCLRSRVDFPFEIPTFRRLLSFERSSQPGNPSVRRTSPVQIGYPVPEFPAFRGIAPLPGYPFRFGKLIRSGESPFRIGCPVRGSGTKEDCSSSILSSRSGRLIRSGGCLFREFRSRSESLSRQRIAPNQGCDLG